MVAPARGAVLGLSIAAAGVAVVVGAWLSQEGRAPRSQRFALSPQECNTECQSRQTDCILDCDGNVACERKCTETGKACVERCKHGPDAGAGSGGAAGAGGGAGRRGTR